MNFKTLKKLKDLSKLSDVLSSDDKMQKLKQLLGNGQLTMNQVFEILINWKDITTKLSYFVCNNGHTFNSSTVVSEKVCPVCKSTDVHILGTGKLECENGFVHDGEVWSIHYSSKAIGRKLTLNGDFKFLFKETTEIFGHVRKSWYVTNDTSEFEISELEAMHIKLRHKCAFL
jgi:hypothetical protein